MSRYTYFAKRKKVSDSFAEAKEQSATMEELDDVLGIRSFEFLLTWLYTGGINFRIQKPSPKGSTFVEFVPLADMYGISQVDVQIAEHLRKLIRQRITYESSISTYFFFEK